MPNPVLSDKIFEREIPADHLRAGWAAVGQEQQQQLQPQPIPPAPDAASPWVPSRPYEAMTIGGSVTASAVLLILLVAGGAVGWQATDVNPLDVQWPGWLFVTMFGALGVAILTVFKPQLARVTAPIYALAQGATVGAISRLYESQFDGIVLQAVALTIGVLAVMLVLFALRIVRATERFRVGVIAATGAICLVYVFDLILNIFGADVPFIHDTGTIGILISLAIVVVAALNLILDFDFIERGVAAGAPKHLEWYAAFGLLVTLVWLYLEMLRLLGKLQRN